MKKLMILTAAVMLAVPAMADTFGTGANQFSMEFVTIGNPGNVADTGGTPGCGAVGYDYRIGKYEVTNAQWNAFAAATGGLTYSYFTGAHQPANNINWYKAAQFCNYLTSGDKNLGAYRLGTNGSITIDRASALSAYGTAYVIPTEDEWYKAAYFKPDGSGYSLYANGTNTAPVAGVNSNYKWAIGSSPWDITNGTPEQNGTFDMMGNVSEWNETLFYTSTRGLRGGSYCSTVDILMSSDLYYTFPSGTGNDIGFRVASIVPEPASLVLLGLGGLALRRKQRR